MKIDLGEIMKARTVVLSGNKIARNPLDGAPSKMYACPVRKPATERNLAGLIAVTPHTAPRRTNNPVVTPEIQAILYLQRVAGNQSVNALLAKKKHLSALEPLAEGDHGQYQPGTSAGRQLLTHGLTHVVQQGVGVGEPRSESTVSDSHEAPERQAEAVSRASAPISVISPGARQGVVYRQHRGPGPVSVRSPVAEEALTQVSDVAGGLVGRALTAAELTPARRVFGSSIDFSRVRIIPTDLLQYRTVGNNIRVPQDFTIDDGSMAETLIHELTHVWQYQHGGTSYLSDSIQTQISAGLRGNRDFAYAYELAPNSSFFDFMPEQQGSIVQNYFAMGRDQASIAKRSTGTYNSNHQGPDGFPTRLTAAQRTAEISRELPLHQRVITQMQTALPSAEAAILLERASEVMRTPGPDVFRDPTREITPVKPLLEIRF